MNTDPLKRKPQVTTPPRVGAPIVTGTGNAGPVKLVLRQPDFSAIRDVPAEIPLPESWSTRKGYFVPASTKQLDAMSEVYREARKQGILREPEGHFERVTEKDLVVDLRALEPAAESALRKEGFAKLSELYYFTSGAGLWSRGGGAVKALVPFNLKELLKDDFEALTKASNVVNAGNLKDAIVASGHRVPSELEIPQLAHKLIDDAKRTIRQLLSRAQKDPEAMNPLDLKFVNVAMQSAIGDTYIPFDVWTSEQTHEQIFDYIESFKHNYREKKFHADPEVNTQIVRSLERYFREAAKRGDTHVFGYQVGYYAMDAKTGDTLHDTAAIGEGAGMAKAYLDVSGRTAKLKADGKKTWVFENIEVVTDLATGAGAHARSQKDVSVVLVPQCPGYTGGSPFMVAKEEGGEANLELHEMSALPGHLRKNNDFFNANTIFQSLDLPPPKTIGFEEKNHGLHVRAKMNSGNVTQEAKTGGIGGRIGKEYENFKIFEEYGANGSNLIFTLQTQWGADSGLVRDTYQEPVGLRAGTLLDIRGGATKKTTPRRPRSNPPGGASAPN